MVNTRTRWQLPLGGEVEFKTFFPKLGNRCVFWVGQSEENVSSFAGEACVLLYHHQPPPPGAIMGPCPGARAPKHQLNRQVMSACLPFSFHCLCWRQLRIIPWWVCVVWDGKLHWRAASAQGQGHWVKGKVPPAKPASCLSMKQQLVLFPPMWVRTDVISAAYKSNNVLIKNVKRERLRLEAPCIHLSSNLTFYKLCVCKRECDILKNVDGTHTLHIIS